VSSVAAGGYLERTIASPTVLCTWEQTAGVDGAQQRVVPDACVDVIWSGSKLWIAGPDTAARVVSLAPGSRVAGVRLRPGAAGAVLGIPASELRDSSPDAADVLGRELAGGLLEGLAAGSDPHALLLRSLAARGGRAPDPLVMAAVVSLGRPCARVDAVADELGVSTRQLQRRVSDAVGYGPKMLARVLRFRRLQTLAPAPFVELALDAGYSDQAHMTAEVTRLAGVSPVRFLKDRASAAA
jgi:AraC-like DNA-binding protein